MAGPGGPFSCNIGVCGRRLLFKDDMTMRHVLNIGGLLILGALAFGAPAAAIADTSGKGDASLRETYLPVPMPAGFRVEINELEGPVFANERGMTLYYWPHRTMRNGVTGDPANQSACTFEKTTHTAGLMSPYPAGLELPELDNRKSCAEVWPPVFATDDAKPVGDFTVITRKDGRKQWAYNEHALYTSFLDKEPGDVLAATTRDMGGAAEQAAIRRVVTPPPAIPPGFAIITTALGRQLLTDKSFSVYMSDRDGPNKSNCDAACTQRWVPVIAAVSAQAQGDWSIFERSPGVRQWAFRKRPLYTYALDAETSSLQGSDVPGWHNVYTQYAPAPPQGFTRQDTDIGIVLADARGMTIYTYNCGDDSADQLDCSQPTAPQSYRLAICGGGKVDRCLRDWPYVVASTGAKSPNRTWTIVEIDSQTGRPAQAGQAGALRVWAYRGVPVYTHIRDKQPGDYEGNANGEFGGGRNGFRAFWLRDDYFDNAGGR
jgi:predicted lipoprotein with Yx(FWY)xxD motif